MCRGVEQQPKGCLRLCTVRKIQSGRYRRGTTSVISVKGDGSVSISVSVRASVLWYDRKRISSANVLLKITRATVQSVTYIILNAVIY